MLLQQLLHSLHVEHVIVVHLFLGGLRALGQRDGAAHCRDRGHRSGEGPWLHTADSGPLPSSWALTHSGDGSGEGHQAQDLAEMRPRPQKMQGEMSTSFFMVTWKRRCQESGAEALTLKMSFSPKEYTGTRGALGRWGDKRRGLVRSAALGGSPHSSPTGSHFPRPSEANDGAPKKYLEEGTYIS